MPSRPRLYRGSKVAGLAAVALFGVLAAGILAAEFGAPAGFPADENITGAIGYALIGLVEESGIPTEGFLVALLVIALALDAALEGSLLLAARDDEGGEQ